MREIKFRGYIPQYLDMKGYFVYGLLVRKIDDICTILSNNEFYAVPCETVGQFTGLHDKNGVEIYDGDILSDGDLSTIVHWNYTEAGFTNGVCDWRELLPHLEVIGNIHEEVVE